MALMIERYQPYSVIVENVRVRSLVVLRHVTSTVRLSIDTDKLKIVANIPMNHRIAGLYATTAKQKEIDVRSDISITCFETPCLSKGNM